jgi:signal peptidase II
VCGGGERVTNSAVVAVAATVVALDQFSKWAIERTMDVHQSIPLIEGVFNLTHVRNRGAAFGLFADLPQVVRLPLFMAVSVGALAVLIVLLRSLRSEERGVRIALAGVLGGAIGNLIDRVQYGAVIDFLDVHWRGYHWPAFNVADSAITIGIIVLLIHSLRPQAAEDG